MFTNYLYTKSFAQTVLFSSLVLACFSSIPATSAETDASFKFDFGSAAKQLGFTHITEAVPYSSERGNGFENGQTVKVSERSVISDKPFSFSVKLTEGNYKVTATFGDLTLDSENTVKAESRRLMLEHLKTTAGKFETGTFVVNVRTAKISSGGEVKLTPREKGPPLVLHWDDKLTLEFNGSHPALSALEITKVDDLPTVYLAGDSTVTDQPNEPWAGWGQMLPRFFRPDLAIANHAESGLALYSFKGQKRLEKILSTMKKDDYLFIQFGHNDQKDKTPGSGPFTSYKENLKYFIGETKKKDGIPVLVTPMERRRFDQAGKPTPTLTDYAEAVRQVGKEENVPVIDLNAMSLKFYEALGPQDSTKAFVHYPANTFPNQDKELKDDTHHNKYGGYELAKCVVEGIKANVPDLAKHLRDDVKPFDPSHPDPAESFNVPASASAASEKPAGS